MGKYYGIAGDYDSWDGAVANSDGYDSPVIFEKTKLSTRAVLKGEVLHERDSVTFSHIQYSWELLASLMWIAAQNRGVLQVLDYGGSLGTSFLQNRFFLSRLPEVSWNIVEQEEHVQEGNRLYANGPVRFFQTIQQCTQHVTPSCIVLSGVLQYLEKPYAAIDQLLALECPYVILDRTLVWEGDHDRICVQNVPPSIYSVRFPCRVFAMRSLREAFVPMGLVEEFFGARSPEADFRCLSYGAIWSLKELSDSLKPLFNSDTGPKAER